MSRNPHSAEIAQALVEAAGRFDLGACERLLADAIAALDPLELIRDVVAPTLREAGDRWHRGEFSVVQEHMLSGVIRRQLANALDRHLQSASGPRVLFTTLSGERHEMGGLMGAVLAASRGYQCIYLGPDLPPEEIARFCAHQPVDALALSLVTQPDVIDAFAQLRELRENVPSNVEIWVAGQAAAILGRQPLPDGVHTLRDLEAFLQRLAALTRS